MHDPAQMTAEDDALARAHALLEMRALPAAIAAFHQAERAGADAGACGAGRWMAHMMMGEFESAWRESDSIRRQGGPDPHRFWNGEPVHGRRVILRCLHGLGDTVQFLRYAPLLQQEAAHVTIQVPPAMLPLARYFSGVEDVITWGNEQPGREQQIEINELPYLFRTTMAALPICTRYLRFGADSCSNQILRRRGARPRVGVVWAAGDWNPSRSIPLHHWRGILQEKGVEFWNLQGGAARAGWKTLLRRQQNLIDAEEWAHGLLPLASLIESLDLVITVDTLAAHLAGALGKPAWVLLQYAADWRWMVAREDSPWYPSLRLFRQPHPGDWASVMQSVQRELARWLCQESRCA
jgi:hypothetical protein